MISFSKFSPDFSGQIKDFSDMEFPLLHSNLELLIDVLKNALKILSKSVRRYIDPPFEFL